MNIVENASQSSPFVGSYGYEDLVWLKPTYNTEFHLSFGTMLGSMNRVSSGTIQTVNTPLEVIVNENLKLFRLFKMLLQL